MHPQQQPTLADQINAMSAQLQLAEAELQLNTDRMAAIKARGAAERALVETICRRLFKEKVTDHERDAVTRFAEAHKSQDEAELRILEVDVAKLKSRAETFKVMIEHGKKQVAAPPPSKLHIPGVSS